MEKPFFTGAATALVTPFLNGAVNYPLFEQLLRRQVDAGIEAVVISGTTGESAALSDEEKLELFTRAKAYVGNACKIIAGTGSNSTVHTITLSMEWTDFWWSLLITTRPPRKDSLHIFHPWHTASISLSFFTTYPAAPEWTFRWRSTGGSAGSPTS